MKTGKNVKDFKVGDKIGVPWLGYSCGKCAFCKKGKENLCDNPGFTGYTIDGGYAEYTVADQRYCFNIPDGYDNYKAAPLLCAGLIGYRSYRMCGSDFETLGIYGFGGAAHIMPSRAPATNRRRTFLSVSARSGRVIRPSRRRSFLMPP